MRSYGKAPSAGSVWVAGASALILALVFLAASSVPAFAVPGHSVVRTFSTGANSNPQPIATDSAGNVYVVARGSGQVRRYDSAGNPSPFSASASYIRGNALSGTPVGQFNMAGYSGAGVAVDRSGGANDGHIYVGFSNEAGGFLDAFDSGGVFLGKLGSFNTVCAVAVNHATGAVYAAEQFANRIARFAPPADPSTATQEAELKANGCSLGVDGAGAVYIGSGAVRKFDASQFGSESPTPASEFESPSTSAVAVDQGSGDIYIDQGTQLVKRNSAGVLQGAPFGALNNSGGVTGDGSGDILATDANGGVFVFAPNEVELPKAITGSTSNVTSKTADVEGIADPDGAGNITGCEFRYGPDSGYSEGSAPCSPAGSISSSTAVTANLSGLSAETTYHYRLFLTNANGTQAGPDQTFATPIAIEGASTGPAANVAKDAAELTGSYTGSGQATSYYFEWGTDNEYGNTTPAPPGNSAGSGTGPQGVTPVHIGGLKGDTTYHYRIVLSDSDGVARGQDETFTTASPITNLTAEPATGITNHSAELHGSFEADSYETHYYFEWGGSTAYGHTTPTPPGNAVSPGSGMAHVPPVPIVGLQEGATYHYRVVATNAAGQTVSADRTFRAAEGPGVGGLSTRGVTAASAELSGEVNPHSGDTTYRFEWGPTTGYGNSIPVPDGAVGSGISPVPVNAQLEGLTPGTTYHFRLVATNPYGTTQSVDQSFGFYPAACPNAQARQETRSNSLPDCRGYELVTPSYAGGSLVFPLNGPNTGLATSPSRISYGAGYGVFPKDAGDPINLYPDLYISTRSDTGWRQKYIGLPATETLQMGGPPTNWVFQYSQNQDPARTQLGTQVSPRMDRAIDYNVGFPGSLGNLGDPSNAPYVWDTSSGQLLERWPTNLGQVADGDQFVGIPQASADFSHFVFSSNLVFAPGGEGSSQSIMCCYGLPDPGPYPGPPKASVYDNDMETGDVVLASQKGDDTPFQGYVFNVSEDGSHILMSEQTNRVYGEHGPAGATPINSAEVTGPLYLRVDAAHTFEIAAGRQIRYVGSTADGKTIYLTSTEQLTADDQDSSRDLFVWQQSSPNTLTRVSAGAGGAGNKDDCPAAWTTGCGVRIIDFSSYAGLAAGGGGNGTSDNFLASKSGDIYFLSPEQLTDVPVNPGDQNLYLYRNGTVRFVVALDNTQLCTFSENASACSDTAVARMQVTPNGDYMALVTNAHLTGYDSGERGEMFTYDPGSGRITCASCRRDGQPPVEEVYASQNGLFQTNDGRVFFSTFDPLVPRDTNESEDIYEYTEGRAQLISAGLGAGLTGYNGFIGAVTRPGLVSVSANGTDVYFATLDSLVTQDHNGRQIKLYDARTGGGFPAEREPARCAAADECHGPSSTQPALPSDRTSANLGKPSKPKAHKGKKHKKTHKKKRQTARSNGKQGRNHRG